MSAPFIFLILKLMTYRRIHWLDSKCNEHGFVASKSKQPELAQLWVAVLKFLGTGFVNVVINFLKQRHWWRLFLFCCFLILLHLYGL
jgi:hypothetical protein